MAICGKRAGPANAIPSVGPTTAAKLLAKMHDTDQEFFDDLCEAKLKSISTCLYWNESTSKPRMY